MSDSPRLAHNPWLMLLIGLITGTMGGLLGIGGGVILIPLLVWIIRFDQREAQGTSLALAVVVVIANLVNYYSQGIVYWDSAAIKLTLILAFAGMFATSAGSSWALRLPVRQLGRAFATVMLFAACWMIASSVGHTSGPAQAPVRPPADFTLAKVLQFISVGVMGGFASGLAGIGGNVVMVPILTQLMHIDQKFAQGYAVGGMLPIVAMGAVKYSRQKVGSLSTVIWLAPGSVAGVFLGGQVLKRLSSPHLKLVFGIFLLLVASWQLITGGPKRAGTATPATAPNSSDGAPDPA